MAVDPTGAVHVVGVQDGDVVYATNAGGEWSFEYPAVPAGIRQTDGVAALAVDSSGRIAVAYERSDCNVGGCMERGGETLVALIRPNDPAPRAVELGDGLQPAIALQDGVVHVVWLAGRWSDDGGGCPRPAMYATNASGQWHTTELAADAANGVFISTRSDGTPAIGLASGCNYLEEPAYVVTLAPDGSPRLDPIPGVEWGDWLIDFATDSNDRTHLVYEDMNGQRRYSSTAEANAWTPSVPLSEGHYIRGLTTDERGFAHMLSVGNQRAWYATNVTGSFAEERVTTDQISDYWGTAAIALDPTGAPHILFSAATQDGAPVELWYATRSRDP